MVKPHTERRFASRFAVCSCIFFFLAGQPFLPRLGVQNDEALFGYAFLPPYGGYSVELGHSRLPLMLMDYVGAFKAWVYRPIVAVAGANVWTLREPALLAGALSLWLFFLLMRRIAGNAAAVIGCGLLAADAMYLLTSGFDWGPVAFQHLLLTGGMLLLVRFYERRGAQALFWGAALLGLAMWDKALAVWMLAGAGVAVLILFPRQIRAVITRRRAGLALAGFLLGALPLAIFNFKTGFSTFRGKAYSLDDLPGKARLLMNTANGSGMFGWLVLEDWQTPNRRGPGNLLERASMTISEATGRPRRGPLLYAFVLALVLAPLARGGRLRAILFALIAMVVQWAQMAITVDAGGSVHHAILLWPLPQMLIAASFSSAAERLGRYAWPAVAATTLLMSVSGVLVVNEYFRLAWQNGGAMNWTEAVFPLAKYVRSAGVSQVFAVDWGITDTLRFLNEGKTPLSLAYDITPESGEPDMGRLKEAVGSPGHIFVAHRKDFEYFQGANDRFVAAAVKAGFQPATVAVIPDSFGRPVYEVYRFEPAL